MPHTLPKNPGLAYPVAAMTRSTFTTTRRELFSTAIGAAFTAGAARTFAAGVVKNGRLKQSVSRWPYAKIPLPDFCRAVAEMGLTAIDLLEEADWPVARQHGLVCSMGYAGGGTIRD